MQVALHPPPAPTTGSPPTRRLARTESADGNQTSLGTAHPSRWPLGLWIVVAALASSWKVDYTLGAFSFAPAAALLAGTWLGPKRGALTQVASSAILGFAGLAFTSLVPAGDWGFRAGLIAAAWTAGQVARPDSSGAHPAAKVRLAVFGAAGATAALAVRLIPQSIPGQVGIYFALTFLFATASAVFFAYRLVPEPVRVIGYAFCLMPYYAAGVGFSWLLVVASPETAAASGIPNRLSDLVFHAYIAHLPPQLIAIVVIAYLVCAIDRREGQERPMVIGAPR